MSELENTLDRTDRLHITKEKINKHKDTVWETIQNETQRKKPM